MKYAIRKFDWGYIGLLGDEKGLYYLSLPNQELKAVYEVLEEQAKGRQIVEDEDFFQSIYTELEKYFKGEIVDFQEIKLQWERVTPYRHKVLKRALEIPYGETRTYKWLAEGAGNPKGARSAGQAMATNPWPIIVPCHRVVGVSGKLTGFGGGLPMKEKLLDLEGENKK